MPVDDGSGDLASYLIVVRKGDCIMRHTFAVLAAAGLLIGTIATGAEARHGMGGFHHVAGRFGGPIIGGVAPMAPIYNSSGGYTVTPSIETPVSPASPGSVFH
jgi:hypothetical protein